jgi:heterodisulfide reductase subunit A
MVEVEEEIEVGAVILAPGYQAYNAAESEEYGFGRYPNVINALQLERLLSASGPTMGHILRPSDNQPPQRIAFLQCIGSRDQSHDYCSAVCCMYATKEAVIAKEHQPGLDIHVFMMDMRAYSKGYWEYFRRAVDQYGINYCRARISAVEELPETKDLILHYQDEEGLLRNDHFDMVVLSVGMEISEPVRDLGRRLGVRLDEYGFCHTAGFNPIESSRPGIFAVGSFREPKDIPESVVEASGAAAASAGLLSHARGSLSRQRQYPQERSVGGSEPRIGVFVCHCGSNIGGFLDVPLVAGYARSLPNVVHSEDNLYSCSQDSIELISQRIVEHDLNRVVVASCSPLTHGPLFQDSIRAAGLNPFLFEMANIRNHCSWVHSNDWRAATDKAKDLVRMAVARAALLEAQPLIDVEVQPAALVVGGGIAGMYAALSLAEQGFPVHLVEKEKVLGGNLRRVFISSEGRDPQATLEQIIKQVLESGLISIHLNSQIKSTTGFMGNFNSIIEHADGHYNEIKHGATILATGAEEYRGPEYGYGTDPKIITQQEFESLLGDPQSGIKEVDSIVMIQCVGPAEQFCSRICCTVALKNALAFKKKSPHSQVVILYRDIRTYGFKERLYTQAREQGVLFVRYDDTRPEVKSDSDGKLFIRTTDPVIGRRLTFSPDLLVLSMPVVPRNDMAESAALFKVPLDANGFYQEAHVKLRPVDFTTDGVFMAGMAHYPKLLDESMVQAQAAAAKAARVLSQRTIEAGGRVAVVDEIACTGCLTCVRICPFGVPIIKPTVAGVGDILGAAYIEAAVCQGCGICAAECPAQAIQLMHYTSLQMRAKVQALVDVAPGFIPLEQIEERRSVDYIFLYNSFYHKE